MNANNPKTIFIGHGKSPLWRELREFISERLNLSYEEFNRIPVAGIPTATRLAEMLDKVSFAFLVMTAEDEQADGKLNARLNVIHEAGLFQGRHGFRKAIVLLEEGCEEFSNIHGLGQIRCPKNNIRAIFEDIRAVLEREQTSQQSNITTVNVRISPPDPNGPPLNYPLKCHAVLQNTSGECVSVNLARYEPNIVTLKDFPLNVLQLRFHDAWWPRPHGANKISVLPDQLFRAWVGPDEKFTEDQLKTSLGRIGTLVFSINGKPFSLAL